MTLASQVPADSLQRVVDRVFASPPYQWEVTPHPLAFLMRWWDAAGLWLQELRADNPVAFYWLFWALVVLLVLIFVHAGWVMYRTVQAASAPADSVLPGAAIERRDAAWYRQEARRLASLGRFAEAIQAEFAALVLELDARAVVRFHPSKTPNEYTYEARLPEPDRERLRRLVRALYGYVFARRPCGPEELERWRAEALETRNAAAVA